jgi:hypothetical protein
MVTPAGHPMYQNPATRPTNSAICPIDFPRLASSEPLRRCRKASLGVEQYQGGQEREGHRPGDDADLGGQVERCRRQERLHPEQARPHQAYVAQAGLPQ